MALRILADENIPLLESFFGDLGEIRQLPGREIGPEAVRQADILLVRSVTPVNAGLLEGSKVKFVGSATAGTDHVDQHWLEEAGIGFASAPGCNAEAVVEYVLACLVLAAQEAGRPLQDYRVGIIGAGNVGGRLWRRLEKLGVATAVNDPPRQEAGDEGLVSLEEALDCDLVTLHTPLTREGAHPTHHLLDAARLERLRPSQILINASRGPVVDNQALNHRLAETPGMRVALDVWEGEPAIDSELAGRVWQATPHIAGYTLEGKVKGTAMVYEALSRFLGLPVRKQAGQFMPEPPLSKLVFTREACAEEATALAVLACYDPRRDTAALRRALRAPETERAGAFDALRRQFRVRREFASIKVQLKGSSALSHRFKALGFKVKD